MKNIGDFGRSLSRTGVPSKYVERENLSAGKKRNILQKNGYLRKSLQYELDGQSIIFSSNMPYAQIHNEGGKISHPGGTAFYKKKKKMAN
jgi:phage gpG-like protein